MDKLHTLGMFTDATVNDRLLLLVKAASHIHLLPDDVRELVNDHCMLKNV